MSTSFFAQFQQENPYQIGSDVLVSHYIKTSTIKSVEAFQNRMTIKFDAAGHTCLVVESKSDVTATFRTILPRLR